MTTLLKADVMSHNVLSNRMATVFDLSHGRKKVNIFPKRWFQVHGDYRKVKNQVYKTNQTTSPHVVFWNGPFFMPGKADKYNIYSKVSGARFSNVVCTEASFGGNNSHFWETYVEEMVWM